MDSLQKTSDEYAYNAWGEEFAHLRNDAAAPKNPLRYVGKSGYYSDDDTGLDLLGVRCYDPLIGRFITPDPSRDGLNWYAYAGNNPTNRTDPTGLAPYVGPEGLDVSGNPFPETFPKVCDSATLSTVRGHIRIGPE